MTTQPSARVVADSISASGHRVTSMAVTKHRFILPEFNTHSSFYRNSGSSRAVPVSKQVERVMSDLAYPVRWPIEQPGMQGYQTLDEDLSEEAESVWRGASMHAVRAVERLAGLGVHKSITNRLIEPFMWHTVIVTSSVWENFFDQRISPHAQDEIRVVAELMKEALDNSAPRLVCNESDAHLPFLWDDEESMDRIEKMTAGLPWWERREWEMRVSSARCARVSYLTHEGVRSVEKDLDLFEKLNSAQPKHWSPMAHVAVPSEDNIQSGEPLVLQNGAETLRYPVGHLARVGALPGWISYRHLMEARGGTPTFR